MSAGRGQGPPEKEPPPGGGRTADEQAQTSKSTILCKHNASPCPAPAEPAGGVARVTILRSDGPRANKRVDCIAPAFEIHKTGAVTGGSYTAQTVDVPDAEALAAILRDIGDDPRLCICLGVFKGAPPGEFRVIPLAAMAAAIGVDPADRAALAGWHEVDGKSTVCRISENVDPGGWQLLDRDLVGGMPERLADLDLDGWLAAMNSILPGVASADRVLLPSTSIRVALNGEPISDKPSWHLYVRVDDPADLRDRVWAQMLIKAFATTLGEALGTDDDVTLGFMRPLYHRSGELAGQPTGACRQWSIFDPTTIGAERLVYDGAPFLVGERLSLAPPNVRAFPGPPLRTRDFEDLPSATRAQVKTETGLKIERRTDGSRTINSLVVPDLRLDQVVETKRGDITVKQAWVAGERVRCQTPFRESDSEAAYINFHTGGEPFLYDIGTVTKHTLHPDDRRGPDPEDYIKALDTMLADVERFERPDQIERAMRFVDGIGAAAKRHGRANTLELDALASIIADDLADRMGQPRSKVRPKVASRVKQAAKGAPEVEEPNGTAADSSDDPLGELNDKYAVALVGDVLRVAEPDAWNPGLKRRHLRLYSPADFKLALSNRHVVEQTSKGSRHVPLGAWWLNHAERRQYLHGVVCDPTLKAGNGYLNLWRGFAVEPNPDGDPAPFVEHVRMITSPQGEVGFDYTIKWLATKIQFPGQKLDVATVFRGREGTGKGLLGHAMLRMFGSHGMHVSQADHLTGKFNLHLVDCLFLFADEAFAAADRRRDSPLKSMITERTITIEGKHKDAFQAANRLGILMASNADWVVPAGPDARRYAVLDVSDERKGDSAYWTRMWQLVNDDDALGAFLHHLLTLDLTDFDVRRTPATAALRDQRIASLEPFDSWLMECLDRGSIERGRDRWEWSPFLPTYTAYESFVAWCQWRGRASDVIPYQTVGQRLAKYFTREKASSADPLGKRPWGYKLGALPTARKRFAANSGLDGYAWSGDS